MTSLFISDLHLDASRPEITDLFLRFLVEQAAQAEALYILGDLFEAWVGDDDNNELADSVRSSLRRLADAGLPMFFLRGNRDFLIGRRFSEETGVCLLADPCVILLYDQPTLLMHGDLLCTDDSVYQSTRQQVRDPIWQDNFLAQPLSARHAFALQARAASRQHQTDLRQTGAMETITDVNPDAVLATLALYGVTRLIHGHTHRPAIHSLTIAGHSAQRIVLGDWYSQGSLLRVSPAGFDLTVL